MGDPGLLGERLPQRGRVTLAAEHAQQVIGAEANGGIPVGSARNCRVSAGMSSADSGGMTS